MPNRLAQETSPYLLQHAGNPVDWYPWGDAALHRAREEDKPIFLSIGYSACHWCHVMEHESFENEALARRLNEHFVCIKVDREERPDLDQIYMAAVQIMTGRGGWPMSVFLTPELQPFYGGTYWPPQARQGMPGFDQILTAVVKAWNERRQEARSHAAELTAHLRQQLTPTPPESGQGAGGRLLVEALGRLEQAFDFSHGGFGSAPKFPQAMNLQQLLRAWHRSQRTAILEMVQLSLDRMAAGGIYDHLGGGFARYSVDERWLVPHFEKMLYDNALLSVTYLEAYQATQAAHYAQIARETLDYVLRDMTDASGGFHSAEDADSEGVEGKFYVWSRAEIVSHLGADLADTFCYVYDVTEGGNFEGRNILNLPKTLDQCARLRGWDATELADSMRSCRTKLWQARELRVRPAKDDKILVSWNGLMIDSLARAGRILDDERYLVAATRAADFLLQHLQQDGRLRHSWRAGQARFAAYLDDYASLANGLLSLYETTFDERWIEQAMRLTEEMRRRFRDAHGGGFFFTADDHETLLARPKELYDSALPSGNGLAATLLMRLGKLCGRSDMVADAQEILDFAVGVMEQSPTAAGQLLIALDWHTGPVPEIALVATPGHPETNEVLRDFWSRYIPCRVLACRAAGDQEHGTAALDPIFLGRSHATPTPALYVCEKFVCSAPAVGRSAIATAWDELVRRGQLLPDRPET